MWRILTDEMIKITFIEVRLNSCLQIFSEVQFDGNFKNSLINSCNAALINL